MSHPVWVCGLKRTFLDVNKNKTGHTLYGCVDWNKSENIYKLATSGHTLYGCVDWNF